MTKRTAKREEAALRALAAKGTILAACQAAGVSRNTFWEWRTEDPAFRERCDAALEEGTDIIEEVVHSIAVRQGNLAACLALLKARRPATWGDRTKHEHSGKDGAPLTINVIEVPSPPREDAG